MILKFNLLLFFVFFQFLINQTYAQDSDCLCKKNDLSCYSHIDPTKNVLPDLKNKIVFTSKNCRYVGNGSTTPTRDKFCLNFAADYYYRLRYTERDVVYKKNDNSQTMHRSKMSRKGALFMLAQVIMESGWGVGGGYATNNYWGLGGNYINSKGQSTLMSFPSFEISFGFLFNHLKRGITVKATDSDSHPGWPDFLKTLEKDDFTAEEINQYLNSGKWCRRNPHYNVDPDPNCKSKKGCPCINYAHYILHSALAGITRQCIPTWKKALANKKITETSIVYVNPPAGLPPKEKRIEIALKDFSEFVQESCLALMK